MAAAAAGAGDGKPTGDTGKSSDAKASDNKPAAAADAFAMHKLICEQLYRGVKLGASLERVPLTLPNLPLAITQYDGATLRAELSPLQTAAQTRTRAAALAADAAADADAALKDATDAAKAVKEAVAAARASAAVGGGAVAGGAGGAGGAPADAAAVAAAAAAAARDAEAARVVAEAKAAAQVQNATDQRNATAQRNRQAKSQLLVAQQALEQKQFEQQQAVQKCVDALQYSSGTTRFDARMTDVESESVDFSAAVTTPLVALSFFHKSQRSLTTVDMLTLVTLLQGKLKALPTVDINCADYLDADFAAELKKQATDVKAQSALDAKNAEFVPVAASQHKQFVQAYEQTSAAVVDGKWAAAAAKFVEKYGSHICTGAFVGGIAKLHRATATTSKSTGGKVGTVDGAAPLSGYGASLGLSVDIATSHDHVVAERAGGKAGGKSDDPDTWADSVESNPKAFPTILTPIYKLMRLAPNASADQKQFHHAVATLVNKMEAQFNERAAARERLNTVTERWCVDHAKYVQRRPLLIDFAMADRQQMCRVVVVPPASGWGPHWFAHEHLIYMSSDVRDHGPKEITPAKFEAMRQAGRWIPLTSKPKFFSDF